MKNTGKGAIILPHGVLFRGNAEATIRRKLVESGILKGIIGLPANLFYGTGIPAAILVLDKENAEGRQGIMMIDASKGFTKDGPKNRLREQDVHRIVDTFRKGEDVDSYARMVPFSEIADPRNDYNLNLPRYIDSSNTEDIQDLQGHLQGGIPERDLDALSVYWDVMPSLRSALFTPMRDGYSTLAPDLADLKPQILEHAEFGAFQDSVNALFAEWRQRNRPKLEALKVGDSPKHLIQDLAEDLLGTFRAAPLVDPYAVYQSLMDYWQAGMQGDAELIAADGWVAKPSRILVIDKKGKTKDKGWMCDLLPKPYIVARYFAEKQAELDAKSAELDAARSEQDELTEEHSAEDGLFAELDKVSAKDVKGLRPSYSGPDNADELATIDRWLKLDSRIISLKKKVNELDAQLDAAAYAQYDKLSEAEVKSLVIDDKWLAELEQQLHAEQDRVSYRLTGRVRDLAERYAEPLPQLEQQVSELQQRVESHLARMGFSTEAQA